MSGMIYVNTGYTGRARCYWRSLLLTRNNQSLLWLSRRSSFQPSRPHFLKAEVLVELFVGLAINLDIGINEVI